MLTLILPAACIISCKTVGSPTQPFAETKKQWLKTKAIVCKKMPYVINKCPQGSTYCLNRFKCFQFEAKAAIQQV